MDDPAIHRFYCYVTIRAKSDEAREFFQMIYPTLKRLKLSWHRIDLLPVGAEPQEVLALLNVKRDEIRARRKQKRNPGKG